MQVGWAGWAATPGLLCSQRAFLELPLQDFLLLHGGAQELPRQGRKRLEAPLPLEFFITPFLFKWSPVLSMEKVVRTNNMSLFLLLGSKLLHGRWGNAFQKIKINLKTFFIFINFKEAILGSSGRTQSRIS